MPKGPDFLREVKDIDVSASLRSLHEGIENTRHETKMVQLRAMIEAEEARHALVLGEIAAGQLPLTKILSSLAIMKMETSDRSKNPFIGDDGRKYWSLAEVMAANRAYRARILSTPSPIETSKFLKKDFERTSNLSKPLNP